MSLTPRSPRLALGSILIFVALSIPYGNGAELQSSCFKFMAGGLSELSIEERALVLEKTLNSSSKELGIQTHEYSLSEILSRSDSDPTKKSLLKALKRFKKEKMTNTAATRLAEDLYTISRGKETLLSDWLELPAGSAERKLIAHEIELEVFTRGVLGLLEKTNGLKASKFSELKEIILANPVTKAGITAALNFGINQSIFPMYLPKIKFLNFSDEMIAKVIATGLTSNWDELISLYGVKAKTQAAYHLSYKYIILLGNLIFTYSMYLEYKMEETQKKEDEERAKAQFKETLKTMSNLKDSLEATALKKESGPKQSLGEALMEDWLKNYRETHKGKSPSKKNREYLEARYVFLGY